MSVQPDGPATISSPAATLTGAQDRDAPSEEPVAGFRKGTPFWMSFIALGVTIFLSAIDLTAVSNALPTITNALNGGDEFSWVGSAYALTSTAILPLSGSFADIFGRKPTMLGSIVMFSVGSAIAGAAHNMNMMIAGRAIQGIGGGGIINLVEIIISDLVPLAERGVYQGLIALVWALAAGVGPPVGGAFAEKASWRWLFYMNLPVCGVAFVLVVFFLRVRTPEGSIMQKLSRVDWSGNAIIMAGSTLAIIGLTWGGVQYPWSDAHVLCPLIIGLVLIGVFFIYEARIPTEPTIPWDIVTNRTSLGGYLGTFVHGLVSISMIYYLPVYFQACLGASPIRSGVEGLPTALIMAPFAMLAGIVISVQNKYRPTNFAGWILTIIGFVMLNLMKADSTTAQWVGYQVLSAAGTGVIYAAVVFVILAPQPVERTAAALAFFSFLRAFAQTWGITISSTILQNELKRYLPPAFTSQFPEGSEIAYAAIPYINSLPEPLRTEVRNAFAKSMAVVWKTMIGISGLGLFSVLLLKEIQMRTVTDAKYGLHEENEKRDEEGRAAKTVDGKGPGELEKRLSDSDVGVSDELRDEQRETHGSLVDSAAIDETRADAPDPHEVDVHPSSEPPA